MNLVPIAACVGKLMVDLSEENECNVRCAIADCEGCLDQITGPRPGRLRL
jgi:hypothetical protein